MLRERELTVLLILFANFYRCRFLFVCLFICYRYGDSCPRSFSARIFGIMWTLTGLVIISILIGAIASSLTSVVVEQPITLYGTKVGPHQE